jgi:HK97 family phage prohead protease
MKVEIKNEKVTLDGYVNAVDRDSKPLPDVGGRSFVERIMPGAFKRALERNDDVFCLLDHCQNRILGSTKQGNVELWEDNIGLRAVCEITDGEVIEKARKDKLSGWSFAFAAAKEHVQPVKEGLERRCIEDLNLFEISIIDDRLVPVYAGTSIEMRAEEIIKIERRACYCKPRIFDMSTVGCDEVSKYQKILEGLKKY